MTNYNRTAPVMDIHDAKRREPESHDGESRHSHNSSVDVIRCHACKNRNSAAQKYCTKCGQLLWEPCVVCETLGPVGQVYCGSCGSHLDTARHNKVGQFEKKLAEAERLRGESCFREAADILKEIAAAPFSCAAKEIQRAKQLLKVCDEQHHTVAEIAETLAARAEEHLQKAEFRQAADLLRRIPKAVRGEAASSLLQMSQENAAEIDRLCGEIETAMNSRLTADAPRKVNRLLELQPAHEKAGQWAKILKQQLFAAAQEKFARCRFDKAEELLNLIPRAEADPRVDNLLRETADLADMDWDIRKSTLLDVHLPAIAESFAKRAPGHPRAAAWLKAMTARIQTAGKNFRQGLPRWTAPPEQPWLGIPIDRPTGFRTIEVDASCAELPCRQHPGRFYTACGLALQGLSQAALNINLIPDRKNVVLRQVSRLMVSRTRDLAWGLDLGSSGLKAVKLSWDNRTQKASMEECYLAEFPKNLQDFVDEGEKAATIQATLRDFREKYPSQNESIAVSLPGRLVLYRVLEFPPMDAKKLAAAVQFEARRAFPFPLDQLVWNFQPLHDKSRRAASAKTEKQTVLLAAAKRSLVEEQLAAFRQAGLRVDIMQSDSLALVNHFTFEGDLPLSGYENPQTQSDADAAVAVFEIGSNTSSFLVCSPRCVWAHGMGFGSNKINQCLMRSFGLTATDAETLKRRPQASDSFRRWNEAVRPVFESLAQEISLSTAMFARSHPGLRIARILGTGGGFQAHGLLRFLHHGR